MKHLPTIKQLQYLLAVADALHFGEAAAKCFVTQSTLSAGFRDLETVLGVQLAERTKRSVRLTSIGRDTVEQARQIIQSSTDMVDRANAGKTLLGGKLRLGIIPTIAPFLLPATLPGIRKQFPALQLILIEDESAAIIDKLQKGELDAIIYALPYATSGLSTLKLFQDRFYLTVPNQHRLANRNKVRVSDFATEEMLLLNQGHCLREHVLAACSLSGSRQARGFDGTSLHTIVQMVAGGLGVTVLPQMAVKAGISKQMGLATILLADQTQTRTIALAWRKTSPRTADFEALGKLLTATG